MAELGFQAGTVPPESMPSAAPGAYDQMVLMQANAICMYSYHASLITYVVIGVNMAQAESPLWSQVKSVLYRSESTRAMLFTMWAGECRVGTELLPSPIIPEALRVHRPWTVGGLWAHPKGLQEDNVSTLVPGMRY